MYKDCVHVFVYFRIKTIRTSTYVRYLDRVYYYCFHFVIVYVRIKCAMYFKCFVIIIKDCDLKYYTCEKLNLFYLKKKIGKKDLSNC